MPKWTYHTQEDVMDAVTAYAESDPIRPSGTRSYWSIRRARETLGWKETTTNDTLAFALSGQGIVHVGYGGETAPHQIARIVEGPATFVEDADGLPIGEPTWRVEVCPVCFLALPHCRNPDHSHDATNVQYGFMDL